MSTTRRLAPDLLRWLRLLVLAGCGAFLGILFMTASADADELSPHRGLATVTDHVSRTDPTPPQARPHRSLEAVNRTVDDLAASAERTLEPVVPLSEPTQDAADALGAALGKAREAVDAPVALNLEPRDTRAHRATNPTHNSARPVSAAAKSTGHRAVRPAAPDASHASVPTSPRSLAIASGASTSRPQSTPAGAPVSAPVPASSPGGATCSAGASSYAAPAVGGASVRPAVVLSAPLPPDAASFRPGPSYSPSFSPD